MPIRIRDIIDLFIYKMRRAAQAGISETEMLYYLGQADMLFQILTNEEKQTWFAGGRLPEAEMAYTYFSTHSEGWHTLRGRPARPYPMGRQ